MNQFKMFLHMEDSISVNLATQAFNKIAHGWVIRKVAKAKAAEKKKAGKAADDEEVQSEPLTTKFTTPVKGSVVEPFAIESKPVDQCCRITCSTKL